MERLQFLDVGTDEKKRRIACLIKPPAIEGVHTILWLIGLQSDMVSTKAEALAAWTAAKGYGLTRFDYSGHGRSTGRIEDATIGHWLEEAEAVLCNRTGSGPVVIAGSSTGAHIALLLLRRLLLHDPREAARISGLVLIAPAWDVTELLWRSLSSVAQREVLEAGIHFQPNDYGEPYAITRRFIEEGRQHLFAGLQFDPGRPIAVLQGVQDKSVPLEHARALKSVIAGDWIRMYEVTDGEHSLSRPEDLEKIFALLESVMR